MLEGSFRPPESVEPAGAPYPRPGPSFTPIAASGSPLPAGGGGPSNASGSPGSGSPDLRNADPAASAAPYVAPWPTYTASGPRNHFDPLGPAGNAAAQPPAKTKNAASKDEKDKDKDGKAKKKPAGSACNSCHRLKTRCSGGSPCERCASHNVACEFDRSLIYRSPLASSSQQASVRNAAQAAAFPSASPEAADGQPVDAAVTSSAGGAAATANGSGKSKKRPRSSTSAAPSTSPLGMSPNPPHPGHPHSHHLQPPAFSAAPPAAGVAHPSYLVHPGAVHVPVGPHAHHPANLDGRLASLESSVASLLHHLGHNGGSLFAGYQPPPNPEEDFGWGPRKRGKSSPKLPPMHAGLAVNVATAGPEREPEETQDAMEVDEEEGMKPKAQPRATRSPVEDGDPVREGTVTKLQARALFDFFVDHCLPNMPLLHHVSFSPIRSRSPFLFSTMVAIGARFSSTQSSFSRRAPPPALVHHEAAARLAGLAHKHLAATLLAPAHTADDVIAALFLASWNLRPEGMGPSRSVVIGHAIRMAITAGLGVGGLEGARDAGSSEWRSRLDEKKLAVAVDCVDALISSHANREATHPCIDASDCPLVDSATKSPHAFDVTSSAVIQATAELAALCRASSAFVTSASRIPASLGASPGEEAMIISSSARHNGALDAWARKWTYSGSSWAPILGSQLRTVKLIADDYCITLNLAVSNLLLACSAANGRTSSGGPVQDCLSSALERVNAASTAVIQVHKDAMREGGSLAYSTDIVTEGLVSAALTVIQLASRPVEAPPTPLSNDSNGPADRPGSSPAAQSVQPASAAGASQQPVMEPAVASHFVKMAAEVLTAGDRSETRLGTRMAARIRQLAGQAGLKDFEPVAGVGAASVQANGGGSPGGRSRAGSAGSPRSVGAPEGSPAPPPAAASDLVATNGVPDSTD